MSVPVHRRMHERDPHESGRVSTPLELFFDLTVVVAVAATAAQLHHAISEGHVLAGLVGYLSVFFGVWWAWVNFTWFSSAYDTDDMAMRFATMVQMAGVLVLAAGVPAASNGDFRVVTFGYAIMRVALVWQWLRARRESGDPEGICGRYALGIFVVQLLWLGRLLLPSAPALQWPIFALLVMGELLVPVYAERGTPGSSWHPEHIVDRYGGFVIICCGEVILSASNTFAAAVEHGLSAQLLMVGVGALLVVFAMWWTYFARNVSEEIAAHGPWTWAYLHYFIFAAVAATGSGIAVMVDLATQDARLPIIGGDLALAVAVFVYLVAVGLAHHAVTGYRHELAISVLIGTVVLLVGLFGHSPGVTTLLIGLVLVGAIVVNAALVARAAGNAKRG